MQGGIRLLSVQLMWWRSCKEDIGRGKDLGKTNTAWKKGVFPLYTFQRSYYVVNYKCVYCNRLLGAVGMLEHMLAYQKKCN